MVAGSGGKRSGRGNGDDYGWELWRAAEVIVDIATGRGLKVVQ